MMKKYICSGLFTLWSGIQLFCWTGCTKKENIKGSAVKPEKQLSDLIPVTGGYVRNRIVHLYKDTVYTLNNFFVRQPGEQLIIDEGTVIKAGAFISNYIIIEPGGLIIANGSRNNPIIFTSSDPAGNQQKNWGGITIQGKSTNNSSRPNGDPADISGSLSYVRIEFAGLILNGVGNGTTIGNVQVSYAAPQSSFEIDGGTFNAVDLVSYACGGPGDFYITEGYAGKMQNILAYRHPYFGSPGSNPGNALTGMFIENTPNDPDAVKPYTYPIISNLTIIGPNAQNGSTLSYSDTLPPRRSAALITTRDCYFRIRNSLLLGFPEAAWYLDDSLTGQHILDSKSELTSSIFQCNDSARAFYLVPDAYTPFLAPDFKTYMRRTVFKNRLFLNAADFRFADPFNYDNPDLLPTDTSILNGADFTGPDYSDVFFNQVMYKGALGTSNWLQGWTNFNPLHTNYNFSQ